jgi:predicted ATPase
MDFDARPVRAFRPGADLQVDESVWPASVPAMGQLLREGLELPAGLTILVGENGSGKSTVVECLAEAYGLNPQGGSVVVATHSPVIAAIPWEDLSLVIAWRQFMRDPLFYFRHLFEDGSDGGES